MTDCCVIAEKRDVRRCRCGALACRDCRYLSACRRCFAPGRYRCTGCAAEYGAASGKILPGYCAACWAAWRERVSENQRAMIARGAIS